MTDDDLVVAPSELSLAGGDMVVPTPVEVTTIPRQGGGAAAESSEPPAPSVAAVRERLAERNRDAHAVAAHENVQLLVTVAELEDGFFAAVYPVYRERGSA